MGNASSKKNKKYKIPPNAEVPSRPGKPEVIIDDGMVSLRWDPPAFDGRCPIIGYTIQHMELETSSGEWLNSNPVLFPECLLQNLIPRVTYEFRIVAENLVGYSEPSESSPPFLFNPAGLEEVIPRFLKELEESLIVLEHERVEMSIEISGQPFPTVEWFLNSTPIQPDGRINFISSGPKKSLVFREVKTCDTGQLHCVISSYLGQAESTCHLIVESPPHIKPNKKYEQGLIYHSGQVIRLKFYFTPTNSKSTVNWYHNGILMDSKNYEISQDSSTLKIMNATREDRGEYIMKVSNDLGEDSGSVLITVTDKPCPPNKPEVVQLSDNSCVLNWNPGDECDDGGSQICSYLVEYYREPWGVWLKALSTKEPVAKIRELIPGSKYRFRVKSENLYGISEPSEESIEIYIPDPSARGGGLMGVLTEHPLEDSETSASEHHQNTSELILSDKESKDRENNNEIKSKNGAILVEKKREESSGKYARNPVGEPLSLSNKRDKEKPIPIAIAPLAQLDDELEEEELPKSPTASSESGGWKKSSFIPSFKPKYSINSPNNAKTELPKFKFEAPKSPKSPKGGDTEFPQFFAKGNIAKASQKEVELPPPAKTPEDDFKLKSKTLPSQREPQKVDAGSERGSREKLSSMTSNSTSTPNIFDHYYMPAAKRQLSSSTSELFKSHKNNPHNKSYFIIEGGSDSEEDDSSLILTTSSLTLPKEKKGQCKITRSDTSLDDLSSSSPRPSVQLSPMNSPSPPISDGNPFNFPSSRSRASFLHDTTPEKPLEKAGETNSTLESQKTFDDELEDFEYEEELLGDYEEEGLEPVVTRDEVLTTMITPEESSSTSGPLFSYLPTLVVSSIAILLCPLLFINMWLTLFSSLLLLIYLLLRSD